MFAFLLAPLAATLRPHFDPSKTRLETLVVLPAGLANCRTVNLSHLASQFSGTALHASNYRRVQRFFQHVRLDGDVVAVLIVHLLNLARPKLPALDRTNWKPGAKDVNILVPAIVTRRFRVPLMWVLPDHQGNSSPAQRVELMRRCLRLVGACSIEALLADREFIGAEWVDFLRECHELCVSALSHAVFRYGHALKRSSHMISNWLRAANHSGTFLPPFSKFRIAGQISLVAASPVGNEPRVLMDLRITRFRLSMAFVVQMILRIAGSKARNGITSCHARRQAGAMEACFPARFSSNASSSSAAKSAAGSAVESAVAAP